MARKRSKSPSRTWKRSQGEDGVWRRTPRFILVRYQHAVRQNGESAVAMGLPSIESLIYFSYEKDGEFTDFCEWSGPINREPVMLAYPLLDDELNWAERVLGLNNELFKSDAADWPALESEIRAWRFARETAAYVGALSLIYSPKEKTRVFRRDGSVFVEARYIIECADGEDVRSYIRKRLHEGVGPPGIRFEKDGNILLQQKDFVSSTDQ